MGLRGVVRIASPVLLLQVLSCMNSAPTSGGFGIDNLGPSAEGDGGDQGDGANGTSRSQTNATGGNGSDAAPANTGSTEAGGHQPTADAGAGGHVEAGNHQQDASVSTPDATTADASAADSTSTTVTYDAAVCTTPNLGCMLPAPPSTGDIRQDCVNRINQFRTQCACLPPLQRWTDGEACADQESTYDSQNMTAHGGFIQTESACGMPGGSSMWAACCSTGPFGAGPSANAQDECPGYPDTTTVIDTCLQQMWNEGPPPNGESVQACEMDTSGCYAQHGHFINMTSTMSTKVACGFSSMTGPLWAAQNFAP